MLSNSNVDLVLVPSLELVGFEYIPAFSDALSEQIVQRRPHCLQDHGLWLPNNHIAAVVAKKFHIPRILSVHGMLLPAARQRHKLRKALAWWAYQRRDTETASLIRVTSEAEGLALRAAGLATPIVIVPNGVEPPAYKLPGPTPDEYGRRTALFLGRIHPIKGLCELINAWAIVRPSNWRLVLAGPYDVRFKARLDQQICSNELQGQVIFLGPVNDCQKWDLLSRAHLFVLPSHSENFGLALVEALAVGTPAIASDGTPWRELVDHRCGWWISNNPKTLASALQEAVAIGDKELAAMGERGARLAMDKYSMTRVASDMLLAYEWLLGGGSPRVPTVP